MDQEKNVMQTAPHKKRSNKIGIQAIFSTLSILIGFIAASTDLHSFFIHKSTDINIELKNTALFVSDTNLKYVYADSVKVDSLWQVVFELENIGDKTIYAYPFDGNTLKDDYISLLVEDYDRLLAINLTNENNGASIFDNNKLRISQWKPKEFVEITIVTQGAKPPSLNISDRDIKDSKIKYTKQFYEKKCYFDGIHIYYLTLHIIFSVVIVCIFIVRICLDFFNKGSEKMKVIINTLGVFTLIIMGVLLTVFAFLVFWIKSLTV